MSTLAATIAMLERLPETDLQAIHDITYSIYTKIQSPFKPLTKNQILDDLAESRKQIEQGECKDLTTAIDEIRGKYGL